MTWFLNNGLTKKRHFNNNDINIKGEQFKIIGEDSMSINVIVHNINQDIFMDNRDIIY